MTVPRLLMTLPRLLSCLLLLTLAAEPAAAVPVPDAEEASRSLDGTWRFKLEHAVSPTTRPAFWGEGYPVHYPAEGDLSDFQAPAHAEDASWSDIAVPGNWEMQGHSVATYREPDNVIGLYRKTFAVPAEWEGQRVLVNFDGVQNGAELWLNGEPVAVDGADEDRPNYHESGWTAWQADLTPHVKFGQENLLALRVFKNTPSADLDSGDYFFLGGIHRPVTLFAVPQTHVADFDYRTTLRDDGKAELTVTAAVAGEDAQTLVVRLGDEEPVTAEVRDGRAQTVQVVTDPQLWSAEHPNLYDLQLELRGGDGEAVQQLARRVGLREVTVEGDVLLVNGRPVKLAGICRHDVWPTTGTAANEEMWRTDLTLMKAANVNTVRTSHYPYGSGFYDLCDEMGMYVLDELPYCWCETHEPELLGAWLRRARETVGRDKNHPSVIIWALGNEVEPGPNLQAAADLVGELDPTRPRLTTRHDATVHDVELNDRHYATVQEMQRLADRTNKAGGFPTLYTENPNVWEIRLGPNNGLDFGVLDQWHHVLTPTWDAVLENDSIPALCPWEWQDRAVVDEFPIKIYDYDPETGLNFLKVKGIVDAFRNPRPHYYHLKKTYAPVRLDPEKFTATDRGVRLDVTNGYSFTNLSELDLRWALLRGNETVREGVAHPDLPPGETGEVALDLGGAPGDADALRLDFDYSDGRNVVTYELRFAPRPPLIELGDGLPENLAFPRLNLVTNDTVRSRARWREITRRYGSLTNLRVNGAAADELPPLADVKELRADVVLDDGQKVAEVTANHDNGAFAYELRWTGDEHDIQELGWTFAMPAKFDRFSWDRHARWSWYPETHVGRPRGTALPDTADQNVMRLTRPDAFDFNSTKHHANAATLADAGGRGLAVVFDPDDRHHVRGGFADDGHALIVNKQNSPPRDLSSKNVPQLYLTLDGGDAVGGQFRVGAIAAEAADE